MEVQNDISALEREKKRLEAERETHLRIIKDVEDERDQLKRETEETIRHLNEMLEVETFKGLRWWFELEELKTDFFRLEAANEDQKEEIKKLERKSEESISHLKDMLQLETRKRMKAGFHLEDLKTDCFRLEAANKDKEDEIHNLEGQVKEMRKFMCSLLITVGLTFFFCFLAFK